jgi:hypothetical protein
LTADESSEREVPRRKGVASFGRIYLRLECSYQREVPRRKGVASFGRIYLRLECSCQREGRRRKGVASAAISNPKRCIVLSERYFALGWFSSSQVYA